MKMKKFFFILPFFLILPNLAFCQQIETAPAVAFGVKEIKTVDIYFGFLPAISKNTWGFAYLNFTPVDGVSRVIVSLVRIVEEQSTSAVIEIRVNGTPCRTPNISSTVGKAQYVADFECTNVINRSGYYAVAIRPSTELNNIHFRAWITYENDPEIQLNQSINYIIETIVRKIEEEIGGISGNIDEVNENIDEVKVLLFDAYETRKYCINNTLVIERISNITLGNKTYPYLKFDNIECEFGCDNERKACNYPNWIYYLLIIFIIIVSYFAVKYIILPMMG